MFVDLQFPLTDVRPFVDEETHRLSAPVWPIVHLPDEPYKAPFVRGFGRTRWRRAGGVEEWPAEDAYCDFSHGLRFVRRSLAGAPSVLPEGWRSYCAFRRMFWDGQLEQSGSVVGRVELGFGLRADAGSAGEIRTDAALNGEQVGRLLDALLMQSVRVADGRDGATTPDGRIAGVVPLSNAGSRLAKACLRRTTQQKQAAALEGREWWLQAGTPLVLVEYTRGREIESLPAGTQPVKLEGAPFQGVRVFLGRRLLEGRERAVWFFEREPDHGGNRDVLRRLRINVTRLHAALSSLRILSDLRLKGKLAPQSEPAQRRLKDCLSTYLPILYRRESLGFVSSDFLAAALSMAETLRPQEFTTLRTLHPAPGRGLRDQLDRADAAVRRMQPAAPPPLEWDIFLAHAGADRAVAEQLFDLLEPPARVFLDSKRLVPGDDWDLVLPRAQERSYMTVVLLGESPETAYYLRSEIASAISLSRIDGERHRVVPVYLQGEAGRANALYGLNLKHGIVVDGTHGLDHAARQILEVVARRKRP